MTPQVSGLGDSEIKEPVSKIEKIGEADWAGDISNIKNSTLNMISHLSLELIEILGLELREDTGYIDLEVINLKLMVEALGTNEDP